MSELREVAEAITDAQAEAAEMLALMAGCPMPDWCEAALMCSFGECAWALGEHGR